MIRMFTVSCIFCFNGLKTSSVQYFLEINGGGIGLFSDKMSTVSVAFSKYATSNMFLHKLSHDYHSNVADNCFYCKINISLQPFGVFKTVFLHCMPRLKK